MTAAMRAKARERQAADYERYLDARAQDTDVPACVTATYVPAIYGAGHFYCLDCRALAPASSIDLDVMDGHERCAGCGAHICTVVERNESTGERSL